MQFIKEIPQTEADKLKKRKSLTASRKALSTCCFVCALLAILLLVGTLVTLFMAELGEHAKETETLLYILSGSFLGGAVLMAGLAVLLSKVAQNALMRELDFIERCDSENSFFVGEGTLATFGNGAVLLHNEKGGKTVKVPYEEMRFFSVCSRHLPKEKGEWSVVLEIPARYLSTSNGESGVALVQTDAKERLYECLKREGLTLIGDLPAQNPEKVKFQRLHKYTRPDKQKRNRALIFIGIGAVVCVAGVVAAFLWEVTLGSVLCVIGAFLLGRAIYSFIKAKSSLEIYKEGLFWNEHGVRAESIFLKWGEIESVETEYAQGVPVLTVRCAYGAYHFPAFEGAEEQIASAKEQAN